MRRAAAATAIICVLFAGGAARAAIIVDMFAAAAPNAFGGASYADWWTNARVAVRDGLTSEAGAGVPRAAYEHLSATGGATTPRPVSEALVTTFESFAGIAGVAGEHGQRIQFIYSIRADAGEALSLSKIKNIEMFQTGLGEINFGIFDFFGFPGGVDFDATTAFNSGSRSGIAKDGGFVTAGTAETYDAANIGNEIVQIIGTFGIGYLPDPSCAGLATDQAVLDCGIAVLGDPLDGLDFVTGTIAYDDARVETTANFAPMPLPGTLALAGAGLLALGATRRRDTSTATPAHA